MMCLYIFKEGIVAMFRKVLLTVHSYVSYIVLCKFNVINDG